MDRRQERWDAARGIIEHEDNLVNHRYTWFFTLQGFLFTGLTFGANALVSGANKEYHGVIHILLLLVAVSGLITPSFIIPVVNAAIRHGRAASYWWRKYGQLPDIDWAALPENHKFPPIKGPAPGEFDYRDFDVTEDAISTRSPWGTYWLPHFLTGVWVLALGMLIYSWVGHARSPLPSGTRMTITQDRQIDNLKVDFSKPAP